MIEELKTWLHKQRDYYLDQMNNDNLKKFGPLELEWLDGKVSFCESVLEFVEKELDELYDWWKDKYLKRDNPWETITKETHGDRYYDFIKKIEEERNEEEQEMLIRLIKIRDKLWI